MPTNDEKTGESVQSDYEPPTGKRYGPFRVRHGRYIGADPDRNMKDARGNELKDPLGNPIPVEMSKDPGSPPFYATVDLLEYNFPGMEPKFELVGGGGDQQKFFPAPKTAPQPREEGETSDGLDELTTEELRQLAKDEEINLGGARNKADVIHAIRTHRNQSYSE